MGFGWLSMTIGAHFRGQTQLPIRPITLFNLEYARAWFWTNDIVIGFRNRFSHFPIGSRDRIRTTSRPINGGTRNCYFDPVIQTFPAAFPLVNNVGWRGHDRWRRSISLSSYLIGPSFVWKWPHKSGVTALNSQIGLLFCSNCWHTANEEWVMTRLRMLFILFQIKLMVC